jgi:hypothetical protein
MPPDAANRNDSSMVDGTAASPRLCALDRRVAGDIAGSLEWLLPQTAVGHDGLFLYYPQRASLAPKLRAFIDVAKKTLKSPEQAISALQGVRVYQARGGIAECASDSLGCRRAHHAVEQRRHLHCGKLTAAIPAGYTAVVKPSKMSAIQTQVVTEALMLFACERPVCAKTGPWN